MQVHIEGADDFKRKIAAIVRDLQTNIEGELTEEAKDLLAKSQELVPVLSGDLKDSGRVVREGRDIVVAYGDEKTDDYALIQHEDTTLNHPRGGQAKFLEQPALEQFDRLQGENGPLGKTVHATVSRYRIL